MLPTSLLMLLIIEFLISTAIDTDAEATPEVVMRGGIPLGIFRVEVGDKYKTLEKRLALAKASEDPFMDPRSPEGRAALMTGFVKKPASQGKEAGFGVLEPLLNSIPI